MKEADGYGLRGETVRKAIEEDVKAGLIPFIVSEWCLHKIGDPLTSVGTVGTTSTGAVDFIAEIGQTRKSCRGYSSLHQ